MCKTLLTIAILALLVTTTVDAAPDDWKAEIQEKLKVSRFSANFEDTPLAESLAVIAAFQKLNIWVDPAVHQERSEDELRVTLRADNLEVGSLLHLMTMVKNITYDLRWGGIFVSTKSRLDSLPLKVKLWYLDRSEENKKLLAKLDKKVNLEFAETPVPDILNFFGAMGGVNVIFLPETADIVNKTAVSLKAVNLSLRHALAAVLLPHGLTWEIGNSMVMVRKAPENPGDAWIEAAERILTRKKVSLGGGLYDEIITHLDEQVPVPIVYDYALQAAGEHPLDEVTYDAREVSVKSALGLVTLKADYAWDYRWESVFISTTERLKALPKNPLPPAEDPEDWERQLRRKLEEDITFDFDSAPVVQAVDFIRQITGMNIVFEPEAREAAEVLPVTLKLENVACKNALAHILYPRNLSFELKHEVIVIRKE